MELIAQIRDTFIDRFHEIVYKWDRRNEAGQVWLDSLIKFTLFILALIVILAVLEAFNVLPRR